jgi:hypothetical protein
MSKRKPKLIYCTNCLAPLNTIKTVYGELEQKNIGDFKYHSKPIIDIIFICDNCKHESGDVVHQKDLRECKLNNLFN